DMRCSSYAYTVYDIAHSKDNSTVDHLTLLERITDNTDSLHKRPLALLNLIMHVDLCRTGRRPFRRNHKIDITTAAVSIGHHLCVVVQRFWRINAALLHF